MSGFTPSLIQLSTSSNGWEFQKFVFQRLNVLGEIESNVYVIPAVNVADTEKESHATWLRTPGAKGQQHNHTDIRRIKNRYGMVLDSAPDGWMDKYLENWELLD